MKAACDAARLCQLQFPAYTVCPVLTVDVVHMQHKSDDRNDQAIASATTAVSWGKAL